MKLILQPDLRVVAKNLDARGVAEASFDAGWTLDELERFFNNRGTRLTEQQWEEIRKRRRWIRNHRQRCLSN